MSLSERAFDPGEAWWGRAPAPRDALVDAAAGLVGGQCVCIGPFLEGVPWRETAVRRLESELRGFGVDLPIETVEADPDGDPAAIVASLCGRRAALEWRGRTAARAAGYVASLCASDTLFWVSCSTARAAASWCDFASALPTEAGRPAHVVVESPAEPCGRKLARVAVRPGMVDLTVFLLDAASCLDPKAPDAWRSYAAALCARARPGDPVGAWEALPAALADGCAPDGAGCGAGSQPGWQAQVECLFPLIERERYELVGAYVDEVGDALEAAGDPAGREGAADVSVGRLAWLSSERDPYGGRLLDLPWQVRSRLALLREARNAIAHGQTCSPADARELLVGSPMSEILRALGRAAG